MSSCGPSGLPKIWRALRGLLGQYQGEVTQDHGTTITAEKPPSLLTILIIIPQKVPRSIPDTCCQYPSITWNSIGKFPIFSSFRSLTRLMIPAKRPPPAAHTLGEFSGFCDVHKANLIQLPQKQPKRWTSNYWETHLFLFSKDLVFFLKTLFLKNFIFFVNIEIAFFLHWVQNIQKHSLLPWIFPSHLLWWMIFFWGKSCNQQVFMMIRPSSGVCSAFCIRTSLPHEHFCFKKYVPETHTSSVKGVRRMSFLFHVWDIVFVWSATLLFKMEIINSQSPKVRCFWQIWELAARLSWAA